jgi:heme/copper-type cytochrome/quinol oxidase subunit 2
MHISGKKLDSIYLLLLILIMVGIPFGIRAYERYLEPEETNSGAIEFTLTGNAQNGWLLGEVQAFDIVSLWEKNPSVQKPVIEVSKGDQVVLKLRSSDVTHGFSLKAFGVYITEGIKPGKTVYVSFNADKVGTFLFTCNVFCGDIHQHMQGTLLVKEQPLASKDASTRP